MSSQRNTVVFRPQGVRLLALAICAIILTYVNHFNNGFHIDDWHTITSNAAIRSLGNIPAFFLDARTSSVLPENQMYRPIVTASTALDYALGHGYVLPWFHFSTFVVFLVQLVAMWWLYRAIVAKTTSEPRLSIVATLAVAWYGLHPAMAETVNYIIQRADLYSTCGVVVAIALYACRPTWRRTGLYLIPAAIALLSKPPAAAFALLLFTYIVMFERDGSAPIRRAIVRTIPALALTIAGLWLQYVMTPRTFAPIATDGRPFLATQPFVLLRFAASAFLPVHLNPDSGLAPVPYFSFEAISGYAFVIAFTAIAIVIARRVPLRPAAFGMFWFLSAALPASVFPVSQTENDHRMFFPFVGLLLAIVWMGALGFDRLRRHGVVANLPRFVVPGAVVIVLACYALATVERNRIWYDDVSMWREIVVHRPHDSRPIMNLGLSELNAGDFAAARAAFERAEREDPTYPEIQINEAVLAKATGHPERVETHLRRAVELGPSDDVAHYWYAKWLHEHGRLRASQTEAERAVELSPTAIDERTLLLDVEHELGEREAARRTAAETLELTPQDAFARSVVNAARSDRSARFISLALESYTKHRYRDAIVASREAIAIDPTSAIAYNDLGAAEAELKEWDAAIAADRKAVSLDPMLAVAKNNLQWALSRGRP